MSDLWTVWGGNVARLRAERGLSLRQLAKAAGAHPSQISRIERGQRGVSDALKARIALVLASEPSELFPLTDKRAA